MTYIDNLPWSEMKAAFRGIAVLGVLLLSLSLSFAQSAGGHSKIECSTLESKILGK